MIDESLGSKLTLAGVVVVAVAAGVGGTLGVLRILPHGSPGAPASANKIAAAASRQIYFADLSDITVSIPPQAGAPATSYVEFGIQFSTYDPRPRSPASPHWSPIIKAEIINLLMSKTSTALQDQNVRSDLIQNCLNISNDVLVKNGAAAAPPPFNAAYITNLVIQN